MRIEACKSVEFSSLFAELYKHIHLGEPPKNGLYGGAGFYLNDEGYNHLYNEILKTLYQLPSIRDTWSERALKDQLHWLLVELVKSKEEISEENQSSINFSSIADQFLENIRIDFDEQEYVIPVNGLSVENPFSVGHVTFWPLTEKLAEIQEYDRFNTYSDLQEHDLCIASSGIAAEMYKAAEILKIRVEEALNVLSYLGSVVWYNQPTRHIYLAGTEPERISYILTRDRMGRVSKVGDTLYSPLPFQADDFFLNAAEGYGLLEFSGWFVDPKTTPLQKLLLNSIQWFGDATQELNPLQAFMKYYIAVESLLKKKNENANKVLPERAAYVSNKRDRRKRIGEIRSLIGERNSVFHEGRSKNTASELLDSHSHQLARNVINSIVQKIRFFRYLPDKHAAKWVTKEDMIDWIDHELANITN